MNAISMHTFQCYTGVARHRRPCCLCSPRKFPSGPSKHVHGTAMYDTWTRPRCPTQCHSCIHVAHLRLSV